VLKESIPQNGKKMVDRKYLGKLRKSFVGHADAMLFLRISREGVFQHTQGHSTQRLAKRFLSFRYLKNYSSLQYMLYRTMT
jgi:hypothetical protein